MPGRKAKPPRLWFREDEGCSVILDHAGRKRRQIRTGCGRDDTDGAAQALDKYIGSRHKPTIGATDPRILSIADILTFYETLKRPRSQDSRKLADHELLLIRLLDLNTFFGAKKVLEPKAQLCRDFTDWSTGTANENNKAAGIPPRDGMVSDQPPAAGLRTCAPRLTRTMPSTRLASCQRLRCRQRRKPTALAHAK
jgi:hypothetical protein